MWLVQFENYEKLKEDLGCASYYELEAKVKNCQEESYYKRFKILEQYKDVFFEAMDATFTKDEQEIFVENMNRIYNGC